jgi:hypothetical protein
MTHLLDLLLDGSRGTDLGLDQITTGENFWYSLINGVRGLDVWSVVVSRKISALERDCPDNRHVSRPIMIDLSFFLPETQKKIFE